MWDNRNEKPVFAAYPTQVVDMLTISSERRIETAALYNAQGTFVKQQSLEGTSGAISFAGLAPGVYLIKTNPNRVAVRVVKK